MVKLVDALKLTSRRHRLLLISSPFLLVTIVCCSIFSELYGSLELGCASMSTLFHSLLNVEKKHMFLLFNVILVIVAKTFNIAASSTSPIEDFKLPSDDGRNAVLTFNSAIKLGASMAPPALTMEGFGSSMDKKAAPESSTIRSCEQKRDRNQQESGLFTAQRDRNQQEGRHRLLLISSPFLLMTIVCCSIFSELYGSLELGCASMSTLFHSLINVEKKHMFLVFNVILVIVAKTFNIAASSTSRFEDFKLPSEDGRNAVLTFNSAIKLGASTASPALTMEGFGSSMDKKGAPESSTIRSCEQKRDRNQQENGLFTAQRDEEEEQTKETMFLIEVGPSNVGFTSEESLDEANKKFDEFIMKTKEKLWFEAQQR